jgi:hypothetical protein
MENIIKRAQVAVKTADFKYIHAFPVLMPGTLEGKINKKTRVFFLLGNTKDRTGYQIRRVTERTDASCRVLWCCEPGMDATVAKWPGSVLMAMVLAGMFFENPGPCPAATQFSMPERGISTQESQ